MFERGQKIFERGQKIFELADGTGIKHCQIIVVFQKLEGKTIPEQSSKSY